MNERGVEGLRQMRAHAHLAITYVKDHPNWREDQFAIDAISKRVELVAEVASYRIPRQVWANYPAIPWLQITGMRLGWCMGTTSWTSMFWERRSNVTFPS